MKPILQVQGLKTYYHTPAGPVKAVDGVSFDLLPGQRFGLVGESGSGKSTVAYSIMRLMRPPANIEAGEVLLDGVDLLQLSNEQMRRVRLAEIAMVSQGAMNSLNPVVRVRQQLLDGLIDHGVHLSDTQANKHIADLLGRVGLKPEVAGMFPHQLSGGMKQRVSMAVAISLRPKVIIADEPTSALDVVVQRRVMQTLRRVQEELGAAVILIGHDMGLMAQFADHVGVMYAGKLVEISPVAEMFEAPQHPYSQLLMESLPSLDRKDAFHSIKDLPPSLLNPPSGCVFHPRCPHVMDRCKTEVPIMQAAEKPGHQAACHLLDEEEKVL
jgi:peptide/nickel transport system ATP-binding protein